MQRLYVLFLTYFISSCVALPTVESLHQRHNSEVRLYTIFRDIITTNLHICPNHRKDYGFKALHFKQSDKHEAVKIWNKAFNLKQQPTVVTVIPNSAAELGGLQIGDVLLSVNNIQWSASGEKKIIFFNELNNALLSSTMHLVVQRDEDNLALLLNGEDICDVYIHLVPVEGTGAYASNKNHVYIEKGLEELLSEESELAYIVSHEIAHVIFSHSAPERKKDLKNTDIRSSMEKEADAMAIRLMVNAGYETEGAITAVEKFDYTNRGPITRFLGYYGAYMPTEQRVRFLKETADELSRKQ